jgi:hypothetical protein
MTRVRRFLAGLFTEHLELKFLALAVALAIFYSRERGEMADRTLQVDLMTMGEESMTDVVRVSPLPRKLEVTVRGPAGRVAALRADLVGPVPLHMNEAVAAGRITIRREMLTLPEGVRLLRVRPETIEFRFERRREKIVPVLLDLGLPDRDVTVDSAATTAQPKQIRISGAESLIAGIRDLRSEEIPLAGRPPGPFEREVRLIVPEAEHVSVSAQSVRARVTLVADMFETLRTGVPVAVETGTEFEGRGDLDYGGTGLRAAVRVRGLRSVVEALSGEDIGLFARVDLGMFHDEDGDGVMQADVPIEAEQRAESWWVTSVAPDRLRMTWTPTPEPPAPEPGVDGGAAAEAGDAGAGDGGR